MHVHSVVEQQRRRSDLILAIQRSPRDVSQKGRVGRHPLPDSDSCADLPLPRPPLELAVFFDPTSLTRRAFGTTETTDKIRLTMEMLQEKQFGTSKVFILASASATSLFTCSSLETSSS